MDEKLNTGVNMRLSSTTNLTGNDIPASAHGLNGVVTLAKADRELRDCFSHFAHLATSICRG